MAVYAAVAAAVLELASAHLTHPDRPLAGRPVRGAPAATVASAPPAVPVTGRDRRRGHRSGTPTGEPDPGGAPTPVGWPVDVPLPGGQLTGSAGTGDRRTVRLLVSGSAAQAHQTAVDFYRARGFVRTGDSVLDRGTRQVTLAVANRDHSPTETYLVISVASR